MTWMDVQLQRGAGSWDVSPDGAWMLYTISTPDWEEAERWSDVSMRDGVSSSRRLTFTDKESEESPTWGPDGSFFVFSLRS